MASPESSPLPEALSPLRDLALDLRWTWSHEADALWEQIDADLWAQSHNPWTLLQTVAPERLARLADDAGFLGELQTLVEKRKTYLERPSWFETTYGPAALGEIAYFSLEFGLGAALPLYAGGLGVLAGDYLKAASDLGAPMVGVGLLYQEGYFRQSLDIEGGQRETYPFNEPATMPIEAAMVGDRWLRVPVSLPGRVLQLRVWRARVGRVTLYLLDSNDPLNAPSDRAVTAKLYDDDLEVRLMQELALGVGGWRALEALGHSVEICHVNEGHAAFALVERARSLAVREGLSFAEALWASRAGNVFTSHTPVASGFDRFDPELVRRYLPDVERQLAAEGASIEAVLGLGRTDPGAQAGVFNMACLAMRGSAVCMGVSRLHGQVSRRIFQPLFPRWPQAEVPVGHITNGVHTPSWDSAQADRVWTEACGKDRWRVADGDLPALIAALSDEDVWTMRGEARQVLVRRVRARLALQLKSRGLEPEAAAQAEGVLDPNVLTLGLARRFTEYKRPNLLLRDPERLGRILLNEQRPVQIVVAGKAHPADMAGKAMIREWIAFAAQPRFRRHVVFLEDYDLALAQELVQGVDVWINTPRRPWEACGTSGMKVLVNGGLNCSVLDGWWAEAYEPDLGWRIGDGWNNDQGALDAAEALSAYELLEREIAPEFHDRDETGVPRAWVARVRRSMSALTSVFSTARMVSDYVEQVYLPAAGALRGRLADGQTAAKDLARWSARLAHAWPGLHIAEPSVARSDGGWRFTVPVFLGEMNPQDVRVELYADGAADGPAQVIRLDQGPPVVGAANGYVFAGEAPASRPAADFTVRVTPERAGVAVPAEVALIAWQR
ncbi:MAG: alpha-glucan family phosphorylase [Caulobacteraceae bacterium]|nr:alpha-glucan family phosphorylase [Caulobacteraceae bacterium]